MRSEKPLLCTVGESAALDILLNPVDKLCFQRNIRRLHDQFRVYASTCPTPFIAQGLSITPEIRIQSELYLPIAEISSVFNRLYRSALHYPPILSSTPFHNALSWADTFVGLSPRFQFSVNPAVLLEKLLEDRGFLTEFLFASFLPDRFYGGIGRYPDQQQFIREWLRKKKTGELHCLDAACGTGEETYGLALLLLEQGYSPEKIRIDGWTLEPLEVWAATHRSFPHDRHREALLRQETSELFEQGCHKRIHFRPVDLTRITNHPPLPKEGTVDIGQFNLIICNGLLGGPIIHGKDQLELVTYNLAALLRPGGILLAANNFHGGWKQKCPQNWLRALFERHGLLYVDTGVGVGGLKPD